MKRKLESRVGVVVPIENPALQPALSNILDIQLADDWSGWEMQPDETYDRRRTPENTGASASHRCDGRHRDIGDGLVETGWQGRLAPAWV